MHRVPHGRWARIGAAAVLAMTLVVPASLASPVATHAASPLVLRVGTTQDLSSLNPWNASLVVDYEAFQLSYDLLVGLGNDLQPIPAFAESWSRSGDGLSWTFKIRPGMKWSDGQPATSEDARFTIQFVLDAHKKDQSVGLGYISAYFVNAGISAVSAPDPETLVVTTAYPTDRVLTLDAPILPKHVWEKQTLDKVADFANDAPVVGTGPYQAVEWKTGQFARFQRNPYYWGPRGAADEVDLRFFPDAQDTMVQAFKKGELDYIRNPSPQQFDQLKSMPGVTTINAPGTGYEELAFNCYAKPIPGGGPSTSAMGDPAFRDAVGYAIDRQTLVDKVLHGYGTPGSTIVPPYYVKFHAEPQTPRMFDLAVAAQKLDAAGYKLNASGQRLDKDGKVLNLRLYFPNSDPVYGTLGQYIVDWFGQVGIKVKGQAFDSGALTDILLPPEAGAKDKASFDMFIWGWEGDNGDPDSLLQVLLTSEIGNLSDSSWSNPAYDTLYAKENQAPDANARATAMGELQQLAYDQAPYQILVYDDGLAAYRTDRFGGWHQMPSGSGVPLFVVGNVDYTQLTDATAPASPSPAASVAAASGAPSASAGAGGVVAASSAPVATPATTPAESSSSSSTTPLLVGAIVLIVILAVGILAWRRGMRRGGPLEDE